MSEPKSTHADDAPDDELTRALAAAFGEDGLSMAIDEGVGKQTANGPFEGSSVPVAVSLVERLVVDENDSSLIRYVKEISTAIYSSSGDSNNSINGQTRYVLFAIEETEFAIPLGCVLEIARCEKVTELPATPQWLRGVTNLRSQILSVVDFRNLIHHESSRPLLGEKLLVVRDKAGVTATAIAVDRVIGIRSSNSQVQLNSHSNATLESISIGNLNFGESSAIVVDVEKLFSCEQMTVFA